MSRLAIRGPILHCVRDSGAATVPPGVNATESAAAPASLAPNVRLHYLPDGLLLLKDGLVESLVDADTVLQTLDRNVPVHHYPGKLIVPGLIDTHIHYVQTDIIAAYGEQLLSWLNTYTFPTEQKFADREHARDAAGFFIGELLRNGTTCAQVLGSVHEHAADEVFEAAGASNLRLIAGKVMMDRNCPDALQDTADSGYRQSRRLIERWHGRDRLCYAITPRFAPTSSPEQLALAGKLAGEFPDTYIHTHVAENRQEIDWVRKLFPDARSYLDVYAQYGLLRERSVLAHCLHLDQTDFELLASTGASITFCPTSNLFLGSGLFDLERANTMGIRVGLGTDVGGGTSFSMFRTLNEAYKVAQMRGYSLSATEALYLATLGGAASLYLDDRLGNLEPGKEADFLVLDPAATPLLARRLRNTEDIDEKLFALLMLGDDRVVSETWIMGQLRMRRPAVH